MSEETKEIEINCVGGFALIHKSGKWFGVFPDMVKVKLVLDYVVNNWEDYQVQEIKEKVPFESRKALQEKYKNSVLPADIAKYIGMLDK